MNNDQTTQTTTEPAGQQQQGTEPQQQQQQQTTEPAANTTTDNQGAAPTDTGNGAQGQQANPPGSINYNFEGVQMPEGIVLNPEESARFIDVIKDMGLSNEQASAIVKYGGEYADRIAEQIFEAHAQEVKGWRDETEKALGADLQKTVGLCDVACRKLNIPGLREALNETGAGNKLPIVRAFARLGELLSEDPGKAAGVSGAATNGGGDIFTAMFPNTDFSKYK